MKPAMIAGLVLALAISASAIPADNNPFGIRQGWGWVWVPPPPPVTDAPTTEASWTDAPTDATTEASSTDASWTDSPTTDAPTTDASVTSAPVTPSPDTTVCLTLTGSAYVCDSSIKRLVDWLVPYLVQALTSLMTKQGRLVSIDLITDLLVQFIICLINALAAADYPVLNAFIALGVPVYP